MLVAILRKELDIARSMNELLQILSVTLLEKEPISPRFFEDIDHLQKIENHNQLMLFNF